MHPVTASASIPAPARVTADPIVPRRFLVLAVVSLLAFVAIYALLVATEAGQRVENLALLGVEFRAEAERAAALQRLSTISAPAFGIALVGLLIVALLGGRGWVGTVAALAMFAAVVAAQVLKEVLPRPELVTGPAWLLRNSFPSGHAAVAAAVGFGVLLVAPNRFRAVVLLLAATFVAVVVDATQRTGWHRLSDTVGSVALTMAAAFAGLALAGRLGLVRRADASRRGSRLFRVALAAAAIAVAVGGFLIALLVAFPVLAAPTGARRAFLQAAFPLLGAGLSVFALVAFARVIEPFAFGGAIATRPPPRPRPAAPARDAAPPPPPPAGG